MRDFASVDIWHAVPIKILGYGAGCHFLAAFTAPIATLDAFVFNSCHYKIEKDAKIL